MSAEVFKPRTGELAYHWDTIKQFGSRALRWALGIENPYTQSKTLPNKVVSSASGGLVHSVVEVPSITESPTASSWQRQRGYEGYKTPGPVQRVEAPKAPQTYLTGVESTKKTAPEPLLNMVQGGLVIGARETPVTSSLPSPAMSHEVHAAGQIGGLPPEQSEQVINTTPESTHANDSANTQE